MKRYTCPNCGNDRFHEVGAVQTTTDVRIVVGPNGPRFVDYVGDEGSEEVWDASSGYFIECSQCLAHIDAEGYKNTMPEDEALNKIHELLDGKEWSPQTLDDIADVVRTVGKDIQPPKEES